MQMLCNQGDCHHIPRQGVCHAGCSAASVTATIYWDKEDVMQVGLAAKVTATIYRDKEGVMQVVLKPEWLPPFTGTRSVSCRLSWSHGDCHHIHGQGGSHAGWPCSQGYCHHLQGQGGCHAGCPALRLLLYYHIQGQGGCHADTLQPR